MTLANWLVGLAGGLPLAAFLVSRALRTTTNKETN